MTNVQTWRVFTTEGNQVISTLWDTRRGPTDDRKVVARCEDPETARAEAERMQRTYDGVREAFVS